MSRRQKVWRPKKEMTLPFKNRQNVWREKNNLNLPPELLGRITETAPYLQPLVRQTSKEYNERYPLRWTHIEEVYSHLLTLITKKDTSEIIAIIESSPGLLPQLATISYEPDPVVQQFFPQSENDTLLDYLYISAYRYSTFEVVTLILSKSRWKVDFRLVLASMIDFPRTFIRNLVKYILKYGPDALYEELYKIVDHLPQSILDAPEFSSEGEGENLEEWPSLQITKLRIIIIREMVENYGIEPNTLDRWQQYLEDILNNWETLKQWMINDMEENMSDDQINNSVRLFHNLIRNTLKAVIGKNII